MAQRKIVWHTLAYRSYSQTVSWYLTNCGVSFAKSFTEGIDDTLLVLSKMPSIGRCLRIVGNKHYCVFVSHPKTLLRYWYDDNEIHLLNIKPTQTK